MYARSGHLSADADVAVTAREQLQRAETAIESLASVQREVLGILVELWPNAAWLASGASSAKNWLLAYTSLSYVEAIRLERVAGLCAGHPRLADAVTSGALSMGRADRLAKTVTSERAPYLAEVLPSFLELAANTLDDEVFLDGVRYWADRVDEAVKVRRVQPHSLFLTQSLFGGGEIHGQLAPSAFANVRSAIDAWIQDPDPADAPHRRTLSERQADALDDLAHFALTHDPDHDGDAGSDDGDGEFEDLRTEDTFDGSYPGDDLDEALATLRDNPGQAGDADAAGGVDSLVLLRRRLRRAEQHRRRRVRRRVRSRSGVCVNVHVDARTLLRLREGTDLDDLIMRGEGWTLTRGALERLACDSALVATIFDGKANLLDTNTAAERFSRAQRRALAARDGHCVFPSCTREPRFCDAHHLDHRAHGGPTTVANGALLCRFHHRLVHEYGWQLLIDSDHWVAVDAHGTRWTGRPHPPSDEQGAPPRPGEGERRRSAMGQAVLPLPERRARHPPTGFVADNPL